MFRTLLVPLDGSELAERALPYAATLASAAGGKLVLVRVALAPAPATLDGANWAQEQSQAVAEAELYLAKVATKLSTRVPVETSVPYGRAGHCILESIIDNAADAVVMATHGRTGLQHLLVGSVAEAVIAGSQVPVFVTHARPGEIPPAPFALARARVVVPLDGSEFATAALSTAVELVGSEGELVLVSVVEPPDEVIRDERGRIRVYLDQQEEAISREPSSAASRARCYAMALRRCWWCTLASQPLPRSCPHRLTSVWPSTSLGLGACGTHDRARATGHPSAVTRNREKALAPLNPTPRGGFETTPWRVAPVGDPQDHRSTHHDQRTPRCQARLTDHLHRLTKRHCRPRPRTSSSLPRRLRGVRSSV